MLKSYDQDVSDISKTGKILEQLYQIDFHLLEIKTSYLHIFFE